VISLLLKLLATPVLKALWTSVVNWAEVMARLMVMEIEIAPGVEEGAAVGAAVGDMVADPVPVPERRP
jgi:hypothetical protein